MFRYLLMKSSFVDIKNVHLKCCSKLFLKPFDNIYIYTYQLSFLKIQFQPNVVQSVCKKYDIIKSGVYCKLEADIY